MFKIAVCDDEPIVCSQIERIILEYIRTNYFNMEIEVFYNGKELCKFIDEKKRFDLIFLDIEMDNLTGIEVGQYIRREYIDYITKIVFISGKNGYERQLFDIQPFNFIPKPIENKKIIDSVELAFKLANINVEVFNYKKGHQVYQIPLKDIKYFESHNREIKLYAIDREDKFYGSLKDIHIQLEKYKFIQIHKSYVINYQYTLNFKYEYITMIDLRQLPISQARRKSIRKWQLNQEKERII